MKSLPLIGGDTEGVIACRANPPATKFAAIAVGSRRDDFVAGCHSADNYTLEPNLPLCRFLHGK